MDDRARKVERTSRTSSSLLSPSVFSCFPCHGLMECRIVPVGSVNNARPGPCWPRDCLQRMDNQTSNRGSEPTVMLDGATFCCLRIETRGWYERRVPRCQSPLIHATDRSLRPGFQQKEAHFRSWLFEQDLFSG